MENLNKVMRGQKMKVLTIAIPTYNRVFTLKQALKYVLQQYSEKIEILVSDNASDDGTEEYMKRICEENKEVIYIRNKKNMGFLKNFQQCARLAAGKYLLFLGDDDILLPNKLNDLILTIERKDDFAFAFLPAASCGEEMFSLGRCTYNLKEGEIKEYNDIFLFMNSVGFYSSFCSSIILDTEMAKKYWEMPDVANNMFPHLVVALKAYQEKRKILCFEEDIVAARTSDHSYSIFKTLFKDWKEVIYKYGVEAGIPYKRRKEVFQDTLADFMNELIYTYRIGEMPFKENYLYLWKNLLFNFKLLKKCFFVLILPLDILRLLDIKFNRKYRASS
jgi:Glycosyltransferases involved in cell wall biogenesis